MQTLPGRRSSRGARSGARRGMAFVIMRKGVFVPAGARREWARHNVGKRGRFQQQRPSDAFDSLQLPGSWCAKYAR